MIVAQVSALKLAWTLAAFIGVLVTFALFFMSITDYKLLNQRKLNGWRKQVAKTSIYIFMGGLGTQLVYFVAGILTLTQSNADGSSTEVRHMTQALFVFGAVVAIVLALVIFYRRLYILEVIENALRKDTGDVEDLDSFKDTSSPSDEY